MKNVSTPVWAFIQITALAIYFFAVASCHKDNSPSVFGNWETVNAIGYQWQYNITDGGQLCKKLPEIFPATSFCFDYAVDASGDVVTVFAPSVESWRWSFVCDDVADVVVTLPDSSIQRFILKRIN